MRLYSGTSQQFIQDTSLNQIAGKLQNAYFDYFKYHPSPSEVNSWNNSLKALALVFINAGLYDHGVILEHKIPLTSFRIDCIICGRNSLGNDNAIIIELKQWSKCCETDGDNEVLTFLAGSQREVLHPSVQAGRYKMFLEDTGAVFGAQLNPVELNACSYLHNYFPDDVILADKFSEAINSYPLFCADDAEKLCGYLSGKLTIGRGIEVLQRIEDSKYKASKKLMDHVAGIIKNKKEYVLLDEQQVIYDRVLTSAKQGFHNKQKVVIIVKGGPGTGKSVIAINLMGDLLSRGLDAQYVTGSRAFTRTLHSKIGARGSQLFKYTHSYETAPPNEVNVIICDEAHRIRDYTTFRFTPKDKKSGIHQVEEILRAAKCSVFFIDDYQVILPKEIGSAEYIKYYALKHNCKVFEYELESQFRCAGSDAFVNWINDTLQIKKTANEYWDTKEAFDFQIFDSPFSLESAVKKKISEGNTGRLVAGFCWKWSNPDNQGNLVDDVIIGDFMRPWNAKSGKGKLAPGIPEEVLWATDPNGFNQIGCIYTAQGFEFDYVGVIVGRDLVYDFCSSQWQGQINYSADRELKSAGEQFVNYIKNSYRVLFSRGMKGCYVYFQDKDTEEFFKSRIEYH